MRKRFWANAVSVLAIILLSACAPAVDPRVAYPETTRGDVVDTYFGDEVADPYRWVETRAGHGAGKPTWMQIEEVADQWAFLAKTLMMEE